jgi:hypothetical protein
LEDLLDIAAAVCTFGRTSVPRDGYRRQVIGQAETEEPYRVKNQLDALARCALALGLDGPDAGALCCRVARDSMPKVRRDVLRALVEADGTPTTQDVAHAVTASWAVAHIALEDLELARVVTSEADQRFATEGGRTPMRWSLRPEFECHISRVFGTSRDV